MEPLVELRGKLLETDRKVKQLAREEAVLAQDRRRAELTLAELEALPNGTRAFRGVGKAFVQEPIDELKMEQQKIARKCEQEQEALESSKKYLSKQMKEVERNFKELMQQQGPDVLQQLMRMAPPSAP